MPTVYIMCGLPFSGKTTLSKEISKFLNISRVSFDETWVEVESDNGKVPGNSPVDQWKYITQFCEQKVVDALKFGKSVVYDNLGDRVEHRQHMVEIANQNSSDAVVVYLEVTKAEVIARRQNNAASQQRHQVSDENFNQALAVFEPPLISEKTMSCLPDQPVETWLESNLRR